MTIGSNSDGGFAVPEEIAAEVERLELVFSPVRRLVKVMRTSTNDFKHLVNIRGTTSGWVGESGSRSATSTPQLRERAPSMGGLYAYPQVSEWALDDIFFNVASWLAEEVAQEFAQEEGTAVKGEAEVRVDVKHLSPQRAIQIATTLHLIAKRAIVLVFDEVEHREKIDQARWLRERESVRKRLRRKIDAKLAELGEAA